MAVGESKSAMRGAELNNIVLCSATKETRNSSGDEIVNVNFLYDDIV